MRKIAGLTTGVALLALVAGCGGSPGTGAPSSRNSSTEPGTTGTTKASPTPAGPLTAA